MRIVLFVACDTTPRCRTMGRRRIVAAFARDCRVGAVELEVRHRVIEKIHVQSDDVGVAAQMLRMAALACHPCRGAPVIAGVLCQIIRHVFVTGETEGVLLLRVEACMAAIAVVLDVRVRLDDRAGHHQPLETRCPPHLGHENPTRQDGHAEEVARHDQYMCTATTWRMTATTMTMNNG